MAHTSYTLILQSRKIGVVGTTTLQEPLGLFCLICPLLFSSSHEVVELGLQGGSHLVRLRAAAAFLLIGVLGGFVRRFLRLLLPLLFLLIVVILLLVFVVLTFVAPEETSTKKVI